MSEFTWVLSPSPAEAHTFTSLTNILKAIGIKVVQSKDQGADNWEELPENIFTLGSRNLVDRGYYVRPETVFGLFKPDARKLFPQSWLLNDHVFTCNAADIPWDGDELFVKNVPGKRFGANINFKAGIYSQANPPKCDADVPVEYSELKEISHEYRAFILNGEVIGSCWYATNGSMTIIPSVPQDVADFFKKCGEYRPETYVLDVARTANGLRIIETNTFNSSGLMGIDLYQFALKVSTHLSTLRPMGYEPCIVVPHAESHEDAVVVFSSARSYSFDDAMKWFKFKLSDASKRILTRNPETGTWFYYGSVVYPNSAVALVKTEHWYNKDHPDYEKD